MELLTFAKAGLGHCPFCVLCVSRCRPRCQWLGLTRNWWVVKWPIISFNVNTLACVILIFLRVVTNILMRSVLSCLRSLCLRLSFSRIIFVEHFSFRSYTAGHIEAQSVERGMAANITCSGTSFGGQTAFV